MLIHGWILVLAIASTAALGQAPYRTNEDNLRGALNAVARKQRSLDATSRDYYNDLSSFKYHGGDPERKFNSDRDRQGIRGTDDDSDDVEFLQNENGQLETVGDDFQGVNNKLLEKTVLDYLENMPEQEESVSSPFRERERNWNHKRDSNTERPRIDGKQLTKLLLEELEDVSPYVQNEMEDEEYLDSPQILRDRYRNDDGNKFYGSNERPIPWTGLFNRNLMNERKTSNDENDLMDRNQEQSILYFIPAERRNVNGRYPIGREFRNYRTMAKRYPVAKRSAKSFQAQKQITDPKVAEDLGALFGAQARDEHNYTRTRNHDHDHAKDHNHEYEYNHKHDHDHDHDHEHDHDHDHDHGNGHDNEHEKHAAYKNASEAPKVTPPSKGQKENITKATKSKGKMIEVKKKSVDWSQYFGIDRRKKKATFVARQGTQNQDDEWMLQRYYENMAENLKPIEHESDKDGNNERKDKLEQMDTRLKNIKDLMIEEALRNSGSEDSVDLQKAKDKVMARMAAAYSLEKMRKALNELRNNIAAHKEGQKPIHVQRNASLSYRDNESSHRNEDKRNDNNVDENDDAEEYNCPELDTIKKRCKIMVNVAEDEYQMFYLPCIMLQICKACTQDDVEGECLGVYAMEAGKICDSLDQRESPKIKEDCTSTALILLELQPPISSTLQCRMNSDSCLRRYHFRYRHRYFRNPYNGRERFHDGYDVAASQTLDR